LYRNFQIGNAWIDDVTSLKGIFDYLWAHALSSDQTHELIEKYCDFSEKVSRICANASRTAFFDERGKIDFSNIYAPRCHDSSLKNASTGFVSIMFLLCLGVHHCCIKGKTTPICIIKVYLYQDFLTKTVH